MASADNGSNGVQTFYSDDKLRWRWIDDSISELIAEMSETMQSVERKASPRTREAFRRCIEEWEHRLLVLVEHMNNFPKINIDKP